MKHLYDYFNRDGEKGIQIIEEFNQLYKEEHGSVQLNEADIDLHVMPLFLRYLSSNHHLLQISIMNCI